VADAAWAIGAAANDSAAIEPAIAIVRGFNSIGASFETVTAPSDRVW
jgi:hypothetical protein